MTEPTTEAGRRLCDDPSVVLMMDGSGDIVGLNEGELELQVAAIEAESELRALDRVWRAFSLVFSFVPDAEEQRLVREHYEADR